MSELEAILSKEFKPLSSRKPPESASESQAISSARDEVRAAADALLTALAKLGGLAAVDAQAMEIAVDGTSGVRDYFGRSAL